MSTKRKKKIRKPAVKSDKKAPKLGYGQTSKNASTLKEIERCDDLEKDFKKDTDI
tara:strand:- start:7181 stop:7345 length:165 start_codon:yes stop_codon:yes gene_type:complete